MGRARPSVRCPGAADSDLRGTAAPRRREQGSAVLTMLTRPGRGRVSSRAGGQAGSGGSEKRCRLELWGVFIYSSEMLY